MSIAPTGSMYTCTEPTSSARSPARPPTRRYSRLCPIQVPKRARTATVGAKRRRRPPDMPGEYPTTVLPPPGHVVAPSALPGWAPWLAAAVMYASALALAAWRRGGGAPPAAGGPGAAGTPPRPAPDPTPPPPPDHPPPPAGP